VEHVEIVEDRKELCSVASKIVSVKIVRLKKTQDALEEGEIIRFDCAESSPTCESKCTYKMLLEDF